MTLLSHYALKMYTLTGRSDKHTNECDDFTPCCLVVHHLIAGNQSEFLSLVSMHTPSLSSTTTCTHQASVLPPPAHTRPQFYHHMHTPGLSSTTTCTHQASVLPPHAHTRPQFYHHMHTLGLSSTTTCTHQASVLPPHAHTRPQFYHHMHTPGLSSTTTCTHQASVLPPNPTDLLVEGVPLILWGCQVKLREREVDFPQELVPTEPVPVPHTQP